MDEEEALAAALRAGLSPKVYRDFHGSLPAGTVIGQLPAVGRPAASAPAAPTASRKVLALIAAGLVMLVAILLLAALSGDVVVPDVTGLPQDEAEAAIENAGLTVGDIETVASEDVNPGNVISQSPEGGSQVSEGDEVALTLSLGQQVVEVPEVVGSTQADAEAALQSAGLTVGEVVEANSSEEAGTVIGQDPRAGARVAEGEAIALTVSSGEGPVTVPDAVGMTEARAEDLLEEAGLESSSSEQESADVPAGNVISQSPEAGTSVERGSTVELVVSSGPASTPTTAPGPTLVTVPDVRGMSQGEAEGAIREAGLTPQSVQSFSGETPAGQVMAQLPAAGESVVQGGTVGLAVSAGAPPSQETAQVPDVTGMQSSEAEAAISAAGLLATTVEVPTGDQQPGTVIGQFPAAGTQILPGGNVLLAVAAAPPPAEADATGDSVQQLPAEQQ
jgi:beta-lactam-binding protein with PASTA domain